MLGATEGTIVGSNETDGLVLGVLLGTAEGVVGKKDVLGV